MAKNGKKKSADLAVLPVPCIFQNGRATDKTCFFTLLRNEFKVGVRMACAFCCRCSPCHARGRGPAHLQPSPFAFSLPAPLVIRFLAMLHRRHKFSDTSSGPRSTPATFKHFLLCGAVVGPGGASRLGPLETLYTQAPGLVPRPGAFRRQHTPRATRAILEYPPPCAHI